MKLELHAVVIRHGAREDDDDQVVCFCLRRLDAYLIKRALEQSFFKADDTYVQTINVADSEKA